MGKERLHITIQLNWTEAAGMETRNHGCITFWVDFTAGPLKMLLELSNWLLHSTEFCPIILSKYIYILLNVAKKLQHQDPRHK